MHINNLPPELIVYILRTCTVPNLSSNKGWEKVLPILAVCKQWRLLALPLVFKQIIVECTTKPEGDEPGYDNETSILSQNHHFARPKLVTRLRSNLSLLPSTHSHVPKSLSIRVNYYTTLCTDLNRIVAMFRAESQSLQHIHYLKVRFAQNENSLLQPIIDLNSNLVNAKIMAKEVVQQLPRVNKLDIDTDYYSPVYFEFDKTLTRLYAPQLSTLTTISSSITRECRLSSTLSDLTVRFTCSDSSDAISVNPETLKHLGMLGFTDVNFSWDMISDKNSPMLTNLSNLESLNMLVSYRISEDADDFGDSEVLVAPMRRFSGTLNAPRLRHVYTDVCPSTCSFLLALSSSHVLRRLGFSLFEGIDIWLDNAKIGHGAKQVFAKHSSALNKRASWIEFTNDIYKIPHFATSSAVYIYSHSIDPIEIDSFVWPTISKLVILAPLDINNMIKMIIQLPSLSVLKAHRVYFGLLFDSVKSLTETFEYEKRIDSQLSHIEIAFDGIQITARLRDQLLKMLHTNLPSLKRTRFLSKAAGSLH